MHQAFFFFPPGRSLEAIYFYLIITAVDGFQSTLLTPGRLPLCTLGGVGLRFNNDRIYII